MSLLLLVCTITTRVWIFRKLQSRSFQNYQAEENPKYQSASLKKERNEKLFPKAHSLVDRKMYYPRIKLSNLQTLLLDGVETGFLLSTFAQELGRKKADVTEIYFTLLQVTGISPTLFLNQNSKTKETRSWIPFKMWTRVAAKNLHTGWCYFCVCVQVAES